MHTPFDFEIKPGLFRLLLALTVVVFHKIPYIPFGNSAVPIFFILSGYWIFNMYDNYYSKQKHAYWLFMLSRCLRLLPLYYLLTLIVVLIMHYFPNTTDYGAVTLSASAWWHTLTLLSYNELPNGEKLLLPSWSLAIEMQFYLLIPLFIWMVKHINKYIIIMICCLLIVIVKFINLNIVHGSVPAYLLYFILGMFIYQYKPVISKWFLNLSVWLIMVVLLVHYAIPSVRANWFNEGFELFNMPYRTLFDAFFPILFVPYIAYSLLKITKLDKKDTLDHTFGNLSYPIYLVHWIPLILIRHNYPDLNVWVSLIVYLMVVMIAALLIYFGFEVHVEKLRKRLIKK